MLTTRFPRLSVLEVAPVGPGVTARQAMAWTTEVAQRVERLGYHRLWMAEHHGVPDIGASAPAVLLAHLAARTSTLRLGSGGVMLPNHRPLVIAEQFSMLHALHPGRIDLGIGRATGAEPSAAQALGTDSSSTAPSRFAEQLDELTAFLNGGFPAGHPYETVRVSPGPDPPPIYLLGSSVGSARLAAARGLPFAFAHHLSPTQSEPALAAYREQFTPSGVLREPYAIITALVSCDERAEEAERAAIWAVTLRVRRQLASKHGRTPTPAEFNLPVLTEEEAVGVAEQLAASSVIMGDRDAVHERLGRLSRDAQADEVMLCTVEYDGPGRFRTLTAAAPRPGAG